jgi:hypothetical protein
MTSQVIDRCVADSHAPLNAPTKQELRMASLHAFVLAALLALPIGSQAANVQPDQEHARLAAMAGRWDVKQSLWEKPGEAPHIDHGTAVFSLVLDNRHLRQDLHIDSPGKPFDGLGYVGYDNAAGEYYSTWMDVNFPGLILAKGSFDPAHSVYTFKGDMAEASKVGARIPLREMLRVIDNNHFIYEYYEDHGAGEVLTVRLEYTRKS